MASVKVERGEVFCRMSKESQFVDLWSLCIIQAISRLPRICFIHLNTAILSSICRSLIITLFSVSLCTAVRVGKDFLEGTETAASVREIWIIWT